ncbi:Hypothetical protein R9X50_00708900 [Acrodontium crateriforme]|uniref:ABM domain-containing protein n=1 Tax=Acrodontium crateriforme TaxID=150365 RepID=A0AAQ3RBZ5_9PEZI|nr:Hypothetical protein R9X50_00708900 [Acrodontium crateriforme]
MPTTEICIVPLVPNADVGDPQAEGAKTFKAFTDTLGQQSGVQGIKFGMEHENADTLQVFIDWDNIDKHKDFMASETYQPFRQNFSSIMAGPPTIFHADMQGSPSKAYGAPVTEVATFWFDGAPPADYIDGATKFGKLIEESKFAGYHGLAVGVTHEELEREGVKGQAAVAIIGWDSVEKHMEFRNTDAFKENIHLLRSSMKKVEMHHVAVMSVAL